MPPLIVDDPSKGENWCIQNQIGGGRRPPSPPPIETPTRLRSRIKPTARDTGLVQQAGHRRALQVEDALPAPASPPPHVTSAIEDNNIDPILHSEPSAPPAQQSDVPDPAIGAGAFPSDSTPADVHQAADSAPTIHRSAELTIPPTRIIPPTPSYAIRPSAHANAIAGSSTDGDIPSQYSQTGDDPSTPTAGRRTAAVNSILAAGFEQLEKILTDLVDQTSLTPHQVLDSWHKTQARVINGINHWNLYGSYAAKHEEQERRRLGLASDILVTPSIRRQLYMKFKEDNPDAWQEILEINELLESSESSPQTVAQRMQAFSKIRRRLTTVLEGAAVKHGFEAALVMCGKVVNEDTSLGFTHTTAGAKKFFETRCRADNDMIIGHLKAHVYNTVSLDIVNEVFENAEQGKEPSVPSAALLLEPGPLTLRTTPSLGADVSDAEKDTMLAMLTSIKDALTDLLHTAGGDTTKFKRSGFPWTTLLGIFGTQGLVLQGWPPGVLMPGQLRNNNARTKGIADLSQSDRRRLHQALVDGEITVTKINSREGRRALADSLAPVIIGVAPPADSMYPKAPQMYACGTIDYEGPSRLPPTAATRIKQKRVARGTVEDPLIISDGSSPGVQIRPAKKFKAEGGAKVPKMSEYVHIHSSDEENAAIEADAVPITKDHGHHDYEDPGANRKRKANLPPVLRASKKRTSAPEPAPVNAAVKKGKQRAVEIKALNPAKRVRTQVFKSAKVIDSSDSEGEDPDFLTVRPMQGPRNEGSTSSDRIIEPSNENVFVLTSASQVHSNRELDAFKLLSVPRALPTATSEPASPSPKCSQPLRGLDKHIDPLSEPMVGDPPVATGSSPSANGDLLAAPVVLPFTQALPCASANDSAHPSVLHGTSTAPSLPSASATSATPPLPPPSRPSSTLPRPVFVREETYQPGNGYERVDQSRHPHMAFRPPPQFFHYPGDGGGMIPAQHAMANMRRGTPFVEDSGVGVYCEDFYRGDPRGIYGGLRARGPGGYQDMRESMPRYPSHIEMFRSYNDASGAHYVGPAGPTIPTMIRPSPSAGAPHTDGLDSNTA